MEPASSSTKIRLAEKADPHHPKRKRHTALAICLSSFMGMFSLGVFLRIGKRRGGRNNDLSIVAGEHGVHLGAAGSGSDEAHHRKDFLCVRAGRLHSICRRRNAGTAHASAERRRIPEKRSTYVSEHRIVFSYCHDTIQACTCKGFSSPSGGFLSFCKYL